MSKLACVVDTCALRHWKGIELTYKPLHYWLEQEFEVRVSGSIVEEIELQRAGWGSEVNAVARKSRRWAWPLQYPHAVEVALLSDFVERSMLNTVEGAGERRNFCVAVGLVRQSPCRHVIFLTDDERAVRGFLISALNTFRVGCIWTSYDLVLYLYARHKRSIPLQAAKEVLRTLTANITNDTIDKGREQEAIMKVNDYYKRLDTITSALSRLPVTTS